MGALSETTSGRENLDMPVDIPIGESGEKDSDIATEAIGRNETNDLGNGSNEEKITIEDGVKFGDTKCNLSTEDKHEIDSMKQQIEELKAQEIKEVILGKVCDLAINCFLHGGISFSGMISGAINNNLSSKLDAVEQNYETRLEMLEKASFENSVIEKYNGENLVEIKANLQEDIHILNEIEKVIELIQNGHEDNGFVKERLSDQDWKDKIEDIGNRFELQPNDNILFVKDSIIHEIRQEIKEIELVEKFENAETKFGDMDRDERREHYMELKNDVNALTEIKNSDGRMLSPEQETYLKECKMDMRGLELLDRQDSFNNAKENNLSLDDFNKLGNSRNSNDSGFSFNLFNNNDSFNDVFRNQNLA